MAGHRLRIALAQVTADADIDAVVGRAAGEGADIVVFPEMISNGYARFDPADQASRAAWIEAAEPIDGAFVGRFRSAARRYGVAILATLLERASPKPFNSALLIDASGNIVLHQRKRHICFFGAPEEACAAGDRSTVVCLPTTAGEVMVGVMICMDREYSDMAADFAHDLRPYNVAAVALYPGLVRTEAVLKAAEYFDLSNSESPRFIGHVIAALWRDPKLMSKSGRVLVAAKLAREYDVADIDGYRRVQSCRVAAGMKGTTRNSLATDIRDSHNRYYGT